MVNFHAAVWHHSAGKGEQNPARRKGWLIFVVDCSGTEIFSRAKLTFHAAADIIRKTFA